MRFAWAGLALVLGFAPARGGVVVRCTVPELVSGRTLHVVRIHDPSAFGDASSVEATANRPPTHLLVPSEKERRFDKQGVCRLRLKKGTYRFEVLYRRPAGLVALTSGEVELKEDGEDAEVVLEAQSPVKLGLTWKGAPLAVTHAQIRLRAWHESVRWNDRDRVSMIRSEIAGPASAVLSPGRDVHVRLRAAAKTEDHDTWFAWWGTVSPAKPVVEINDSKPSEVDFTYEGTDGEPGSISNAQLTVHLPENDTIRIALGPRARFITNRRFIEASYSYETATGELLSFNRRSRVLGRKTTIPWGGKLTPKAYARMTMSWNNATPRSLIWGAYLFTKNHDVLNTWVPPKKNAISSDTWEKDKKYNTIPLAKIGWKETLIRRDEGEMPADPLWMTKEYVEEKFPSLDELEKVFQVRVSYRVGGESVQEDLPLSKWVTWKSKRTLIEAPPEWEGRARAYLDKAERTMDYCVPQSKYIPKGIQFFWTNNKMAGYTCGPKTMKRIQMGVFDLRRRQDLFTTLAIMAHEQLHAHGYGHGAEHDRLIRQSNTWFQQHHQALAHHPEYVPYPVTRVPEIESAHNDWGALGYSAGKKIRTLAATPKRRTASRRGGLGLGRKKPKPETKRVAVPSVAAKPSAGASGWVGLRVRKQGSLLEITGVDRFSPAAKANIPTGDHLFQVQGKVVTDVEAVRAVLAGVSPGGTVKITFLRNGAAYSTVIRTVEIRPGVECGADGF